MKELKITDTEIGTGKEAVKGALISVHYQGLLETGMEFDSSKKTRETIPICFRSGKSDQRMGSGIDGNERGGQTNPAHSESPRVRGTCYWTHSLPFKFNFSHRASGVFSAGVMESILR
jgi:hypothetical protein